MMKKHGYDDLEKSKPAGKTRTKPTAGEKSIEDLEEDGKDSKV